MTSRSHLQRALQRAIEDVEADTARLRASRATLAVLVDKVERLAGDEATRAVEVGAARAAARAAEIVTVH